MSHDDSSDSTSQAKRHRYHRRTRRAAWWLAGISALTAITAQLDGADLEFARVSFAAAAVFFVWGLDAHARLRKFSSLDG